MNPCLTIVILALATVPPAESGGRKDVDRAAAPKHPSTAPDEAMPPAEQILRALQRQRPQNEVVAPGSAAGYTGAWTPPKKPLLWPDGFSLVAKTGSLRQDSDRWWLDFDSGQGETPPSIELLPNGNLEVMVRMVSGSPAPIRFSVSGELTVFEGRNLLLIRAASRTTPLAAADQAAGPATPRIRSDAAAEDVLGKLRLQSPEATVLPPSAGDYAVRAARDGEASGPILADGAPVVHRVGRLLRHEGGWTLVSDSQRADSREAPLRLLPNQALEAMVRQTQGGSAGLVFIVSGEATLCFGRNYLLARAATRRIDLGNLRP